MIGWRIAATVGLALCACGPAHQLGTDLGSVAGDDPPTLRLPDDVRPTHYTLTLDLDPDHDRYSGTVEIALSLSHARRTVWLLARDLRMDQVTLDGAAASTTAAPGSTDGLVGVRAGHIVGPGDAILRISFNGAFSSDTEGIYRTSVEGRRYVFTQFEPVDARRAFPCFDEPHFKAPFDVALTIPANQRAIGNGPEIENVLAGKEARRVRFATTAPLPTYLVALAVGPFDVVDAAVPPSAIRARTLPLRGVATAGHGKEMSYALATAGEAIARLETYFGTPFPYPKVDLIAVPDMRYGAMENVGAITFETSLLLLDERTATLDLKKSAIATITHELSHQWFGDLVTMDWWDDLWLNESFASWMEPHTMIPWHPELEPALDVWGSAEGAKGADSMITARRIRQPIASRDDIENAFDSITYNKGAAVLSMFERWMGPDHFRDGVRRYLDEHREKTATVDDLLRALGDAAGRDVATPLRTFLDQEGVPRIAVRPVCATEGAWLELSQRRYLPVGSSGNTDRLWQIPVRARYFAGGRVREVSTLLETKTARVPLDSCPVWVLPNADAEGYFEWTLPAADLRHLIDKGWRSLSTVEKASVVSSIDSAFNAADLHVDDALALMAPLVNDPHVEVAAAPMGIVSMARGLLVEESQRPRVAAYARALYRKSHARLAWDRAPGETTAERKLRGALIAFLTSTGRDPGLRAEAARRGRAYLGIGRDNALHPEVVDPDLAGMCVALAVEEGGAPVFDAALALLQRTHDLVERGRLLGALGATKSPALSARALALTFDSSLLVGERRIALGEQLGMRETREMAWRWLQANFDAVVAGMPESERGSIVQYTPGGCSEARTVEIEAFFAPRIKGLAGAPRLFASVLEGERLCVAQVNAQRDSARRFFAH